MNKIAEEAQKGFAASSAYDAYRPSYPPEAVSKLLSALSVAGVQGAAVADLAAGTGKFTELLVARPEKFNVLAIEPHDGMRQELERKNLRGLKVVVGTAENMAEVATESLDALVVAQAFHWFANRKALEEISRVLKPTGTLGLIWNIEDYNAPNSWELSTDWERTIRTLTWTFDDGKPRFRHHENWRKVFDEQMGTNPLSILTADPLFSLPLGEDKVNFETWLAKEDVWKRYRTISHIAVLEGDELEKTRKVFWDAIDDKNVQTDEQGRVAVHGHTVLVWTSRVPSEPLKNGG